MTIAHRYIIVLDRYDDDDHCGADGHEPRTDLEGMEQVAAELQEAMAQTGEPAGFFKVIARYGVTRDELDLIHTTASDATLRKTVRKALKSYVPTTELEST